MIKTKIISTVFIFMILIGCTNNKSNLDCSTFRTGEFYYREKITNNIVNFTRNDSVQIETNENDGNVMIEKVKWEKPCKYELILLSKKRIDTANDSVEKKIQEIERTTPLITNIVSTGKNFYVFESRMEGVKTILKDTIWLKK